MECIGCKAFNEGKDIKPGTKSKCFICGKDLVKQDISSEDNLEMLKKMFNF